MWRARTIAVLIAVVARSASAQPSEAERKRREIEQQLQLPKKPPAPAPAKEPEPEPAPAAAPGAAPTAPPPPPVFVGETHRLLVGSCGACHAAGGAAAATRLILRGAPRADYDAARALLDPKRPRQSLLLTKGAGEIHGGGPVALPTSRIYRRLLAWITAGALYEVPGAPPTAAVPAPRPRRPRPVPAPVPVPVAPPVPVPAPVAEAKPEATATPQAPAPDRGPDFATRVHPLIVMACRGCHNPAGTAAATRFLLTGDAATDHTVLQPYVNLGNPGASPLVTKGAGVMHGGGVIAPAGSDIQTTVLAWIAAGAPALPPPPPEAAVPEPGAPAPRPQAPALPPLPPPAPSGHPHGGAIALPFGFQLDGRFDLNYERRGLGRDTSFADGVSALRSYHQFLFLSRNAEDDPVGLSVELIALQFWEGTLRHRFAHIPLTVLVRGGKLLVPFGNEPLFHQAYGGLIGFDQKILPPVWAAEGLGASFVFRPKTIALTSDLYFVRGYRLKQADAVLNLQSDGSPADDLAPGLGARLGAALGPLTAYYSAFFNPLGFDRRLVMQAVDLSLWRPRGIPVLDRLALGMGFLRADVSGGGAGEDYYHFGSYWQARFYAADFLYLQYRQGLRTFNNRRGAIVDETRLTADDGSTHMLAVGARFHGLSASVSHFINLEKADEVDDDFFRISVAYEF